MSLSPESLGAMAPGIAAPFAQQYFQHQENKKFNDANIRQSEATNRMQMDMANKNIALQKEFAKMGVQWKVEDAKKAGIHPLYALGANTMSFSPVSVGSSTPNLSPDTSMSDAVGSMGQNISRAMAATQTKEQRAMNALQLENQALQNEELRLRIRQNTNPNPPFPGSDSGNFMPGQGDSPLVLVKPKERAASAKGRPAQEAGWVPDVGYSRTDTGLTPVVPSSLSESLEDDIIGKAMWRVRNQLLPNFGEGKPPKSMLPQGASDWSYSFWRQEWQPHYSSKTPDSPYDTWSRAVSNWKPWYSNFTE